MITTSIRFRDSSGREQLVAGLTPNAGDVAYGATTTREGTALIPATAVQVYGYVDITFDQDMPDSNYIVTYNPSTTIFSLGVTNKTKSGFRLMYKNVSNAASSADTIPYNMQHGQDPDKLPLHPQYRRYRREYPP